MLTRDLYIGGEKKYLEFNLANVMQGSQIITLEAGDVVRIRKATEPLENFVSIQGDEIRLFRNAFPAR